jgi:hypothetical protein
MYAVRLGFKLLISLYLTSCGSGKVVDIKGFEVYVYSFIEDASDYGKDVPLDDLIVEFGNTRRHSELAIGTCTRGNHTPLVLIDEEYWTTASEQERYAIIYHELGHCLLNRRHVEDYKSLMNPTIKKDFYLYEEYYLTELFTRRVLE